MLDLHEKFGMVGMEDTKGSCLWFDLKRTKHFEHWRGKLIIRWPGMALSFWRWAGLSGAKEAPGFRAGAPSNPGHPSIHCRQRHKVPQYPVVDRLATCLLRDVSCGWCRGDGFQGSSLQWCGLNEFQRSSLSTPLCSSIVDVVASSGKLAESVS